MRPTAVPARLCLLAGASALALAACAPDGAAGAFAEERVVEPVGAEIRWGASSAERFRFERPTSTAAPAAPSGLSWTTPPGWTVLPPTALRSPNFRVAGDERAECYVTALAGEAGGLEANVNRWRAQMSQPPLSAAEIAALPRVAWLGQDAVLVEFDGTWTGMGGAAAESDYRLAGLLLVSPSGSRFLKMVGPRDVVARETGALRDLAASFRAGAAPGRAAPAAADAGSESEFTWTTPAGWKLGPAKAMRSFTLVAGEASDAECYVSTLAGEGGGLAANLNRWRQQMGQEPLGDAEIERLPQVTLLGGPATLIEVARSDGPAADMVLGAASVRPDRSVFVKMVGPRSAVERERAAFLDFCRSLRTQR